MKPKVSADLFFHIVLNTWFCASDADWMIRCGRGTQKSMQMSVRWWAEFNNTEKTDDSLEDDLIKHYRSKHLKKMKHAQINH